MRYIPNLAQLVRRISTLTDIARERGVHVQLCTDFEEFSAVYKDARKGERMTPIFDPAECGVGGHNAYWLKGTNADGHVVFLQAARCDRFGEESLADRLDRELLMYPPQHIEVVPSRCYARAEATKHIKGDVVYHGETWLRPGPDGCRGRGLGPIMIRLGVLLCLLRWNPDYVWAFVSEGSIKCGLALQYGFPHHQADGAVWTGVGLEEQLRDWIIWIDRDEMVSLANESRYSAHEGDRDLLLRAA